MGISAKCADTTAFPASSRITASSPGIASFDIKSIFDNWCAGQSEYGFALTYEGGTNSSVIIESSEAGSSYYATLNITYTTITPVIKNGTYLLNNGESDTYMQIDDNDAPNYNTSGSILELWDLNGEDYQKWNIQYLHNGYYKIVSAKSGKAISVQGGEEGTDGQELVQYNYTGRTRQQWKITKTSHGMYKIKARSSESYSTDLCMAAGAGILTYAGRNVEQRKYVNDSNYKDEWNIYSYDKSMLLAINDEDGYNRHDYFTMTKINLQAVINSKVSVVSTLRYTSCSTSDMINYMKNNDILFVHTHGSKTSIKLGTSTHLYISNLNGEDLSNLKLVVLLTCNTAQDYDISHITTNRPQNIVEKMVVCGAETVIGFTGKTWTNDCSIFARELSYRLISDGMTVDDALFSMGKNNDDDKDPNRIDFNHSDFLDLATVAGNGNNKLR